MLVEPNISRKDSNGLSTGLRQRIDGRDRELSNIIRNEGNCQVEIYRKVFLLNVNETLHMG